MTEATGETAKPLVKKTRLVTVAGILAAVVGGYFSVSFAWANITFFSMVSSPSFRLSMSNTVVPVGMPPAAAILARYPFQFFVFSLIFWLSVSTLGVGVFLRRKWARGGFNALLYAGAAVFFLLLIFPELVVPKPVYYQGEAFSPEFNSAVKAAKIWLQAVCGPCAALFFWLARKLETPAVKSEFERGPGI